MDKVYFMYVDLSNKKVADGRKNNLLFKIKKSELNLLFGEKRG